MMLLPMIAFWVLLYAGRDELGWRWIVALIALWVFSFTGIMHGYLQPHVFTIGQALLDIVLVLVIYGGDIRLRP